MPTAVTASKAWGPFPRRWGPGNPGKMPNFRIWVSHLSLETDMDGLFFSVEGGCEIYIQLLQEMDLMCVYIYTYLIIFAYRFIHMVKCLFACFVI